MTELEVAHTVDAGENVPTVEVPKSSLLKVVRKLDFNAPVPDAEFAAAFDDLRAVFTPDEVAFGNHPYKTGE
ncbi:hypothetical protein [Pseudovibrio sp. Tun.PSC04-5.I4]|uniref:hypothetical protein n=1 Tax=Pseudovibrio sp. Tun.PSC04-5.I4 TaxID=1798213 RepID=UPI000B8063EC|nr:hypothetical protein [Pseudovibrio sp. Tun.PSC04-5.I4]